MIASDAWTQATRSTSSRRSADQAANEIMRLRAENQHLRSMADLSEFWRDHTDDLLNPKYASEFIDAVEVVDLRAAGEILVAFIERSGHADLCPDNDNRCWCGYDNAIGSWRKVCGDERDAT